MGVRDRLKQYLIGKQEKKYQANLQAATVSYDEWIRQREDKDRLEEAIDSRFEEEFQICVCGEGVLSERAKAYLQAAVAQQPEAVLLYGDEDILEEQGRRKDPWFKPDWSPDTFLSYFYFGSVVAIRKSVLAGLEQEGKIGLNLTENKIEELYNTCYYICHDCMCNHTWQTQIIHVDHILFHGTDNRTKDNEDRRVRPAAYERFSQIQLTAQQVSRFGMSRIEEEDISFKKEKEELVSIVIPSKDNPAVLKACIESIRHTVKEQPYEILVVDNGSKEENRQWIASYTDKNSIRYLYHPMEFNFSAMCNLGVSHANGVYILLLNDDITAAESGWLEKMTQQAAKPYVGAVGAKLRYPHSSQIQHAGITNIAMGPVHKLQFMDDDLTFYDGRNRMCRNVLAVTGACLLLRKEYYEQVGGMSEVLRVAFNDVDLCFSLWESGYFQVIRNDIFLYHHESFSRGGDESSEKWQRLMKERDLLYARHSELRGRDPFYSKHLNGDALDTAIVPAYVRGREKQADKGIPRICRNLPAGVREDACLLVRIEHLQQQDSIVQVCGYSVILGSNNACYSKEMLLQQISIIETEEQKTEAGQKGAMWRVSLSPQYRSDIQDNMPDQVHASMSGFDIRIPTGSLPKGTYRVGVLAKDSCSRTRILNWTNRSFTIAGSMEK